MGKWKTGAVGAMVGAGIYHILRSINESIPRLVPEVVLDADVAEKHPVYGLRMHEMRPYIYTQEASEEPDIQPMCLRLRNRQERSSECKSCRRERSWGDRSVGY